MDTAQIENCGWQQSAIAQLPAGTMLDERALAFHLKTSPRSVRRMIARGELPAGVRLGGRKIWFSDKVLQYLEARAERMAVEGAKKAKRLANMDLI